MGEVVSAIQKVTQLVNDIDGASNEQSTGMDQVGKAITQIDQATQMNAALVEEMAAATERLKSQAQELVARDSVHAYLYQPTWITVANARLQGLWKDSGSSAPCLLAGTLADIESALKALGPVCRARGPGQARLLGVHLPGRAFGIKYNSSGWLSTDPQGQMAVATGSTLAIAACAVRRPTARRKLRRKASCGNSAFTSAASTKALLSASRLAAACSAGEAWAPQAQRSARGRSAS